MAPVWAERIDTDTFCGPELKEQLKSLNEKVSGNKAEQQSRLQQALLRRGVVLIRQANWLSPDKSCKTVNASEIDAFLRLHEDLIRRCETDDVEGMRSLVQQGAKLTWQDRAGTPTMTPLFTVAERGSVRCLDLLLQSSSVDLEHKEDAGPQQLPDGRTIETEIHGVSALTIASRSGHDTCVTRLLAAGADVEKSDSKNFAPLHGSCLHGHQGCVKILLAAGATYNKEDSQGHTPLHQCFDGGHVECAQLLLAAGATIDHQTRYTRTTPLMFAAQHGYLDCVHMALGAGADVHLTNQKGGTALYACAEMGHTDCAILLLEAGAKVDAPTNDQANGTFAQMSAGGGVTPLYNAVTKGHMSLANALLAYGADPSIRTKLSPNERDGCQSALMYANSVQGTRFDTGCLELLEGPRPPRPPVPQAKECLTVNRARPSVSRSWRNPALAGGESSKEQEENASPHSVPGMERSKGGAVGQLRPDSTTQGYFEHRKRTRTTVTKESDSERKIVKKVGKPEGPCCACQRAIPAGSAGKAGWQAKYKFATYGEGSTCKNVVFWFHASCCPAEDPLTDALALGFFLGMKCPHIEGDEASSSRAGDMGEASNKRAKTEALVQAPAPAAGGKRPALPSDAGKPPGKRAAPPPTEVIDLCDSD